MSNTWILPGWGLGRAPLQPLADALNAQFLDLPGYQDTSAIDDFDLAIDHLAQTLPQGSTLIGWSLGAICSLALAARHPNRVSRLILIAATPAFAQHADWPHGMPRDTLDSFTENTLSNPVAGIPRFIRLFNQGDQHAKSITRSLLDALAPLDDLSVLATGLGWLAKIDLRTSLDKVCQPTLLLHGDLDPLMPVSAAQYLATRLSDAHLAVLPNCAHAPFLSAPDTCLAHIRDFLDV